MHPHTRPSVAGFFCRIIVCSIWTRCEEIWTEFIWSGFDFLEKEDIRIIGRYERLEFSLFLDSTDTIHVPGDDAHSSYR